MSLEDFAREVVGKRPKDRGMTDRMLMTDEDGCSYDRQVIVSRIPLGVGILFIGGLMTVAWASGDPAWTEWTAKLAHLFDLVKSMARTTMT